ncbi:hypothetical protein [Kribbella sp. NPDC048915]|uniref:hypothetical protein n=1 Tax=Kribbella sp. NPDC048915 TaxID=3155148 RepID=UPI00340F062C
MLTLLLVLTVLGPLAVWYIASLLDSSEHERWLRALDALRELESDDRTDDRSNERQPGSDDPAGTQRVADGNDPGRNWRLLPERIN